MNRNQLFIICNVITILLSSYGLYYIGLQYRESSITRSFAIQIFIILILFMFVSVLNAQHLSIIEMNKHQVTLYLKKKGKK